MRDQELAMKRGSCRVTHLVAEVAKRVVGSDEGVDVVAAERGRRMMAAVVQTGASTSFD